MTVRQQNKIFKGQLFHFDATKGFYVDKTGKFLQDYAWEQYKGSIPEGYVVKFKTDDVSNANLLNLTLEKVENDADTTTKVVENVVTEEKVLEKKTSVCNLTDDARQKAVAWHKSEEGHKWHKEQIKKQRENDVFVKELICDNCGKSYQGIYNSGANHFCSSACKSQYRRKNGLDLVEVTCPVCNNVYKTNKFRPSKTCSRACANQIRYQK